MSEKTLGLYDRHFVYIVDDDREQPIWAAFIERKGEPIYRQQFYGPTAEEDAREWARIRMEQQAGRWTK